MIHIGWVPTCWVWICCSKPVETHKHTHTQGCESVQQLPKQHLQCFSFRPCSIIFWIVYEAAVGEVGEGVTLTIHSNSDDVRRKSLLRNPHHPLLASFNCNNSLIDDLNSVSNIWWLFQSAAMGWGERSAGRKEIWERGSEQEASYLLGHNLFDLWFHVAVHCFGFKKKRQGKNSPQRS